MDHLQRVNFQAFYIEKQEREKQRTSSSRSIEDERKSGSGEGIKRENPFMLFEHLAVFVETLDGVDAHLHLRMQPHREDDGQREVERVGDDQPGR